MSGQKNVRKTQKNCACKKFFFEILFPSLSRVESMVKYVRIKVYTHDVSLLVSFNGSMWLVVVSESFCF